MTEGLRENAWTTNYLVPIMLLRKFIFAFIIVTTFDVQMLKLFGIILIQLFYISFLLSGRPYESRLKNNMEIFNEMCILMIMISFIPFTDHYAFDTDMR